ncbi:MAG: hypothetical protein ACRDOI_12465 [Trebonia sp.]
MSETGPLQTAGDKRGRAAVSGFALTFGESRKLSIAARTVGPPASAGCRLPRWVSSFVTVAAASLRPGRPTG